MIRFNNHDKNHINALKKAYEKYQHLKKKWNFIADEMNKEFEYSVKDTWRTRYRRLDKDYIKRIQVQKSINHYKNKSTGEVKNLLIKLLNRPKNIDFVEQATGLSETEILGYVSQINLESVYHIKSIKSDSKITLFLDRSGFEKTREYNYDIQNKKVFKFMILGDSTEELQNELTEIKKWFTSTDYIPNKIITGEWLTTDQRWIDYLLERTIKRARQDEITNLLNI